MNQRITCLSIDTFAPYIEMQHYKFRAPDTMQNVVKKGTLKSYEGKMKQLLKPYNLSIEVTSAATISNETWISAIYSIDTDVQTELCDTNADSKVDRKEIVSAFERALEKDQDPTQRTTEVIGSGVTRFDALKQHLIQKHDVDEKEIDVLHQIVMENGYESETLLMSEQWMSSGKAPWNQLEYAQFIASFFRDRECMTTLSLCIVTVACSLKLSI